ncbi:MAG: hypothetical protein JST50_08410 [Bacteroidetes bacterium]|jgi:hypothetical protein|nr:hypothetical protein [Bacteroidota bacterium]
MKNNALLSCQSMGLGLVWVLLLLSACSHSNPVSGSDDNRLQGDWKLKDGDTKLKITKKKFAMDSDLQYAEDYFVKGDTIFSSFQGNQPYSKFVIQKLDDHNLKLLSPDSTVMEFTK